MFFDYGHMIGILPDLCRAIPITLAVTFLPVLAGAVLGFLIALIRNYRVPVLSQLCAVYISLARGIPLFILLFVFYYGVPKLFGFSIQAVPALVTGLFAMTFHATAYLSEIIRGALKSVDQHQMEAARSIGMTTGCAYRRIILPQAVAVALPNIFNFLLGSLKSSSLVFAIGIIDIMATAKIAAERGYRFIESYTIVAILYVVAGIVFAQLFKRLELRAKARMGGLADEK